MKWPSHRSLLACGFLVLGSAACSGVLGLDSFHVGDVNGDDGGGGDASQLDGSNITDASGTLDGAVDGPLVCDDPVKKCYACTPTQNDQFLNSCTTGDCQPFDKTRLMGLFSADGGLPPFPDGG